VPDRRDFVEAAPTLPGDLRIRLPPASPHRYDGEEMDGLSPPYVTTAPRGAGGFGSDKSPRQSASKKSDKSIKQKRAMKKAKKAAAEKPS
jgi:hypothetical protein